MGQSPHDVVGSPWGENQSRGRALVDGRAMSGSTEWLGTTGGCENRRGGAPTTCLRGRFARALGERSGNSDSAISRGGVLGSDKTHTDTGRVDRLQGGSEDNEKSRARSH
jgi:hypothetical protein